MDKKNSLSWWGFLLGAAGVVVLYGEFAKNLPIILGGGAGMALCLYFFTAAVLKGKAEREEQLLSRLEEMEKIEKALYVVAKDNFIELKKQGEQREESIHGAAAEITDNQKLSAKLVAKYSREDIKKLAAIDKADHDKLVVTVRQSIERLERVIEAQNTDVRPVVKSLDANFKELKAEMESLKESLSQYLGEQGKYAVTTAYTSGLSEAALSAEESVMETSAAEELVTEAEPDTQEQGKQEEESEVQLKEEAKQEEESEVQPKEEAKRDEESEVQPHEEAKQEEESEVQPHEEEKSEAEPVVEPEPVREEPVYPEPVMETISPEPEKTEEEKEENPESGNVVPDEPAVTKEDDNSSSAAAVPEDPGRALSPDEIAALFSSIG